jgi:hypothetical protein
MTEPSTNDSIHVEELRTNQTSVSIPWWVSIIVILGTVLIVAGAVISKVAPTILTNGSPMTEAARVYADYLFARNLALAIMLLLLLTIRARQMLAGFMVLIALIQVIDVINDLSRGAFLLAPGLLVLAIVFLAGAWRLFGEAPWHIDAWRKLDGSRLAFRDADITK